MRGYPARLVHGAQPPLHCRAIASLLRALRVREVRVRQKEPYARKVSNLHNMQRLTSMLGKSCPTARLSGKIVKGRHILVHCLSITTLIFGDT